MRASLLCLCGTLLMTIPASTGSADTGEDAKLNAFFKSFLDEDAKIAPVAASRLGDHRYDHLLDDVSATARAKSLERYKKTLAELAQRVDYAKLTRPGQIDYEIWKRDLE